MALWFEDEHSEFLWGLLVATWTKGEPVGELSHIPADQLQAPADLADLLRQLGLVGIETTIPPQYTGLEVVREKPGTLLVRLPEKEELIAAEQTLANSEGYRLPHFYETFLGPLHADTPAKQLEFQKCRIGDYAIAGCM